MVYFPARKCYHAIKISILLILVLTLISLFEHWRGGKRSAAAVSTSLSSSEEEEFGRQILEDEARIIPGLGEGGVAAHLSGEDKRLGEESEKKLAMNVYLSDRIAYNRTLKDYRNPACARVVYDAELPSVSVILIFHNEPYSVVVRTIWSVLNSARRDQPWMSQANFVERDTGRIMNLGYPGQDASSPFVYLKEIILVDDNSTLPELKGKLSHYVKTRLPPELIRILRLPDRIGLTQARQAGAREAVSDVMIFLDSHCEGAPDWIRPILQRIKDKRNAVVTPLIDVIEQDTFQYQTGNREFEGLMKARMRGARAARGDVLVFLDAHCEAGRDWLRPLLQRIRHKRDAVITPLIDVIDQTTFKLEAADVFQVGGFTFMGHFTWIDVPEREKRRRGSDIAPTWSPTMAGGLFAINRAYYWEIGAYDEQMAGWGGENLEMSFRIWQCGGTLETIPCSRVGHVFRSFHPYGLPAHTDTHGINTARMAEVWMDEYAELFYLHRPDLRNNPKIGDVTHRKVLREKLHCKSFQWYLDNIYRDKFVPVRDVYGYGRFMNPATGFCLDTMQREADLSPLGVYPCHPQLQATQYLSLSLSGELRNEEDCAQVQFNRHQEDAGELGLGRKVLMSACAKKHKSQKWKYVVKSGEVQQVESGLCLDAGFESGGDALARPCSGAARQRWLIDYADHNGFTPATPPDDSEYKAREKRLQALRGQRRISRSLFSYGEGESRRRKRKRTHKRKNKRKNKFILKLVRTLMNNSAEHLEAELRCRHRILYPNNTFVRDIVTILNERNIKVINNGRVFSRNGVGLVRPDAKSAGQLGAGTGAVAGAPDRGVGGGAGQQKVKHSNRQKHQNTTGESNALPAFDTPASGAEPQPDPEEDKRIIIEDFVEVKPLTTTELTKRHKKKHKRKRHRVTSTPRLPLAPVAGEAHPQGGPSEGRHSPLTLLAKQMADQVEQFRPPAKADQSMEETGMVSGEENSPSAVTHTTDLEDWPLGESRFRRNNSLMQPLRRSERRQNNPLHFNEGTDLESDQDVAQNRLVSSAEADHPPAGDEHPPVKLVMRTNLTFNLDDNFFKSRTNEASEDLTISNTPRAAPPVKLLIKSDDSSGDLRGETDDNRGEYEGNRVESVQDESSGSSDSSNTS